MDQRTSRPIPQQRNGRQQRQREGGKERRERPKKKEKAQKKERQETVEFILSFKSMKKQTAHIECTYGVCV